MATDYAREWVEFGEWLLEANAHRQMKRVASNGQLRGRCPRPGHDDKDPSFAYNASTGAWACSCGGGKASELMTELGWTSQTPLPPRSQAPTPSKPKAAPPTRQPDDVYEYENGNRKLKWRFQQGEKSAIQWRHSDGSFTVKGDPGIYRLSRVPSTAEIVHVSESESDADALASLGFAAIATPHGATSPMKEIPPALHKKKLVVWEHQDAPGRKYAGDTVAIALSAGVAASIVRPAKPHKDVRDWIKAGATSDELQKVARAALRGFPEAEEAVDLMQAEIPPLDYVIRPVLSIGNLTILQGEPKGGKSCKALLLAISSALGQWTAGRWESCGRPRMTLFVTWEDGRLRVQTRLRQYLAGMGQMPTPRPTHLKIYANDKAPRIRLEDPQGVALLRRIVQEYQIEVVILDTLSHLTAVDENVKKEMQPVMDALKDLARECRCAVMVLHHASKPSKDGAKSVVYRSRGSSVIAAAADVILDWGVREGNVTPCSLISKDDDGDRFSVEYLPDGDEVVRWRLSDLVDEGDDKYGNRKAIIEALSKLIGASPTGVTRSQVAAETKLARNTVIRHLEQMAEEGSIQKVQRVNEKGGGKSSVYAPVTHVFQP